MSKKGKKKREGKRAKKAIKARSKAHTNGAKATAPPKPRQREEIPAILRSFGRYLNRRRGEQQMSIRDFAKQIGIPFSNLFQFEQLVKNPRLTELEMLAHGLGESLPLFMERVLAPDDSEPRTNVTIV